jgi:hypothetical protein
MYARAGVNFRGNTCHIPLSRMKTFTTSSKGHKVASRLSHQWFTQSFNACLLRLTDALDTASRANQRKLSEWLRKISFRMLSDLAGLVTIGVWLC